MVEKICEATGQSFEVTNEDLEFLESISPVFKHRKYLIDPPRLCPEKRLQRRLAFTNQIYLFNRHCSGTGKMLISMFTEDVPFPVIPLCRRTLPCPGLSFPLWETLITKGSPAS